jgi:hypothetical protein
MVGHHHTRNRKTFHSLAFYAFAFLLNNYLLCWMIEKSLALERRELTQSGLVEFKFGTFEQTYGAHGTNQPKPQTKEERKNEARHHRHPRTSLLRKSLS